MSEDRDTCCSGVTLQRSVKIIAVLEMIFCAVLITALSVLMVNITIEGRFSIYLEVFFGLQREVQFLLGYGCWTFVLIKFILDASLYKGAIKNSPEACRIWLKVSAGILIMANVWSLLSINLLWDFRKCVTILTVGVLLAVYRGLEMFVVYKYIKEIKRPNSQLHSSSTATTVLNVEPQPLAQFEIDIVDGDGDDDKENCPPIYFSNAHSNRGQPGRYPDLNQEFSRINR